MEITRQLRRLGLLAWALWLECTQDKTSVECVTRVGTSGQHLQALIIAKWAKELAFVLIVTITNFRVDNI